MWYTNQTYVIYLAIVTLNWYRTYFHGHIEQFDFQIATSIIPYYDKTDLIHQHQSLYSVYLK